MDREELLKLHAALGSLLALPDSIRELLAQWLETSKPNGRDPHPPPIAPTGTSSELEDVSARRSPTPVRRGKPANVKAERKLLETMRTHPGLTVIDLAKAAGAGRSVTGERLRRLSRDGAVEKDPEGRWRLVGDLAGEEARPLEASPS